MFYGNLLYFLIVIFVFSTSSVRSAPLLSPAVAIPLFATLCFLYSRVALALFRRCRHGSSADYFTTERKLSILAVLLFSLAVYGFDLKWYLHPLTFAGSLPILENIGALTVFFGLLALMWLQGRRVYERVFHRSYPARTFVFSNIKANLPVVLPWLVLSFVFDLLASLQVPWLTRILDTQWGDLLLFSVFVLFLALFFPPLIRWLWGCRPLASGPLREHIEHFCRQHGFSSEILYWPLFEGQMLTAGIVGIVPGFRYILVTPALLSALDLSELEAVLSHEIGHVKKRHLLLYIVLFLGFSLLAGALAEPFPYLILSSEFYYGLLSMTHVSPEALLTFLGAVPLLFFMLVYFRFVFGYFIRNFERQADLFVFRTQGTSGPLIRAFEKIAALSGNIRDRKNWHHFGIGERIDFLLRCEKEQSLIAAHDRKVRYSLLLYLGLIGVLVWAIRQVDVEELASGYELRYTEAVLQQKLRHEPNNSLWLQLLGDLMVNSKMEAKAIEAYSRALELTPLNAEISNNLAWLLLTAKDPSLRDPERALILARSAAMLREEGFILDTLAVACWANGLLEEAILTEVKAMRIDPGNRAYYQEQIDRFQRESWQKEASGHQDAAAHD